MKPEEFCNKAAALVSGERAKQHGPPLINHENIAALWSAYLGHPITAHDAALMMVLLKIARTKTGEYNPDDYVDGIGYLAIAGSFAPPATDRRFDDGPLMVDHR